MIFIKKIPDTKEKLALLSRDSQYDLACACAPQKDEHRQRSIENKWIYPVTFADGRTTYLLKTLLSNECVNNCKYCPLRAGSKADRCTLSPEEMTKIFLYYYNQHRVNGLFLSSAVRSNPDATMEGINRVALNLRKMQFKGYIHLKIIPGASQAAIQQSVSLASAVSLNIETAGKDHFKILSTTKDYLQDILRPIQYISRLTAKGSPNSRVKQTTQFVVGAAKETDREIINYSFKLYKELGLSRVYFSAYQRGTGEADLPGENSGLSNGELLTREHRLYQVDWLMRKYGFQANEIPFEANGNLSLAMDPKELWAKHHPEFFPVDINRDDKYRLLRVPGLGQIMVDRLLELRKEGARIRDLKDIGIRNRLLTKAQSYVIF
jgi:predicted DNA-binding helix-hairpin-helix protein